MLHPFRSIFGWAVQDGELSLASRWSCKSALGTTGEDCVIEYDLAEEYSFQEVRVGENIPDDLTLLRLSSFAP